MKEQHVINCNNVPDIDMTKQDGGLSHMKGVYTYQIRRSCRSNGDYTYNHAPMLTGFNNRLLLSYISGKRDEHGAPDKIVYTTSKDGEVWEEERVLFPYLLADTQGYTGPDKELLPKHAPTIVHFRMCFYEASNGCMLATTFYGFSPDFHRAPNNGYGAARVVREVKKDFTLSDMYVIKYNTAGGFDNSNTFFYNPENDLPYEVPYYKESSDKNFVNACDELLSQKLILEQWYEEEMYDKKHFVHSRALSFYEAKDGNIVGLCKKGEGYIFDKEGNVLLDEKIPSLITNTAKVWGQKTPQNDYIICYNPTTDGSHRWPLVTMRSEDGREFYNMQALIPEIPPYRYQGNIKNLGAQYMRGICSYNDAFDENVWITYSCNKEDIWISKITSDTKYSVMSLLWGSVKKVETVNSVENGVNINSDIWRVIDKDACERAIIEYFPENVDFDKDKSINLKVSVDIETLSDNNGVKVTVYTKNGTVKEYIYKEGHNEINFDNELKDIDRVAVYSKADLKLNTLEEDGRYSTLQDLEDAERKDYYTEFKVTFSEYKNVK